MIESENAITEARECFLTGDAARGKELVFSEAMRRLNEVCTFQFRTGDLVRVAESTYATRPHPRKDRLVQILEQELSRNSLGDPLPPNVPPSNWQGILLELESARLA